jgi:hypothetical protein
MPVSACAHHDAPLLPQMHKDAGVDAIVLTNHCYHSHLERLSADPIEQAKIYVETFHRAKEAGDQIGFKVFFGCELKLINEPNRPEFLLFGISEEDFLSSFPLYRKTQKEVFDFCNAKDILMVQAHPYRVKQGYAPADMKYVHGIEIYNPHPHFNSRLEDSIALAEENGLFKTAGSDFHVSSQAGNAGMIVPDDINDQFMLRDYIKTGKAKLYSKQGIIFEE